MELRHLRSFVVLADERHFGRSATRLHIAQPALSQQIKQLEHELGCLLFDRSTRRVELTEAGRLLLDRAQVILGEADRAQDDLSQLSAGRLGRVAVGFIGTATYDVLPRVAQRVRAQLPALTLDLRGELLSPELVDGLHERRFDLAVMRTGPGGTDDLVVETLREERLVAVLPAGHRLAGSGTVALGDLADEPFVTYPAGPRSTGRLPAPRRGRGRRDRDPGGLRRSGPRRRPGAGAGAGAAARRGRLRPAEGDAGVRRPRPGSASGRLPGRAAGGRGDPGSGRGLTAPVRHRRATCSTSHTASVTGGRPAISAATARAASR